MDHVTATSSAVAGVAAKQQKAGRFATHSQLFDTFHALVMDMQGKFMDPSKTQQVAARDVARMERPSDSREESFRDRYTPRDADAAETQGLSRYQERKRQFGDDHAVSQRDDAGREYNDGRRADQNDVGAAERNSQADNDRGNSRENRQDVANRDGNSGRDARNGADGEKAAVNKTDTGNDGQNGAQSGTQGQGQAAGENAKVVQASVAAGQVDTLLTTIVAQTMNTETGKQVSQIARNIGDEISDAAKTIQQSAQGQRGGNHELIQANVQAKQIRNIANIHTNGQATGDGAKQAESLLQAQAGKIAEAAGNDAKLMVNVNVKDEAAAMNGRSLASLTSAAALAAGQQQSAQQGQQAQTAQQTQMQNPMVQAAMVQSHQNPAQPQTAQVQAQTGPAAQAQTAAQLTADAKGPVQASSGASNAGTHTFNSGGESTTTQAGSNTSQTHSNQGSQHAEKTRQSHQPQNTAKNKVVDQVSVQINKAVKAGADKINIRLRPADLGRVEVRLDVSHDGRTVATVTADKPETLEMLRRDSDQLSKALQDAGLDMEAGDLNYNLKGQDDGKEQKQTASGNTGNEEPAEDDSLNPELMDTAMAAHEVGILHNGRVDVRA